MFSRNRQLRSAAAFAAPVCTGAVFETMEDRRLMSVTFAADIQQLQVLGTAGNDAIDVSLSNGKIKVVENGVASLHSMTNVKSIKIDGRAGNDTIALSSGFTLPSQLLGHTGNDLIRGGNAADALFGGDGNDTLDGRGGADAMFGGSGVDTADYSSRTAAVKVSIGDGYLDDGVAGEMDSVEADVENVWGGSGNDRLFGTKYANELRGNGGDDVLQGFEGDDTLRGGAGNDELYAAAGNDKLFGEAGNDYLWGDWGNDSLFGGDGNDRLNGNDGNDWLMGEAGNDIFDGGSGSDRYHGGSGTDTVSYGNRVASLRLSIDGVADDGENGEADNLHTDIEVLHGGQGNDRITGSNNAEKLFGGAGDDWISGMGGNDVVYGEAGNDRLFGGVGGDALYGGAGNDTLVTVDSVGDIAFGGLGTDLFWVNAADTTDADAVEKSNGNVVTVSSFSNGASIEPAGQDLADPSLTGLGKTNAVYGPRFDTNPLFRGSGPAIGDVDQQDLGSCYLLATLAGVAQAQPDLIRQSVTDLGDGTYAVRYFVGGKATFVRVDSQLPVVMGTDNPAYAQTPGNSMWAAIMEKAYCYIDGNGTYIGIVGGFGDDVFRHLGQKADFWDTIWHTEADMAAKIKDVLSKGGSVVVNTDPGELVTSLVPNHVYTVVSISGNNVTLRNPWNIDGDGGTGSANDALITMNMTRFDDDIWQMAWSYL